MGRIAKSFSTDTPIQSSLKVNAGIQHKSHAATPGCDGAVDNASYLWKAEVWVATSEEYSAYIEIVDVLGKVLPTAGPLINSIESYTTPKPLTASHILCYTIVAMVNKECILHITFNA